MIGETICQCGHPMGKHRLDGCMLDDCETEPTAMTVASLMAILSTLDPKAVVILEGCDCAEDLGWVSTDTQGPNPEKVFLRRIDRSDIP